MQKKSVLINDRGQQVPVSDQLFMICQLLLNDFKKEKVVTKERDPLDVNFNSMLSDFKVRLKN